MLLLQGDREAMKGRLEYPESPKYPIKNVIHGAEIIDNYQWLEDSESDQTKNWIEKQNKLTEELISEKAEQGKFYDRLKTLFQYEQFLGVVERNGFKFYMKKHIEKQQPILYRLSKEEKEIVLVDVNETDPSGLTSLDYFFPNENGTLVAYGISQGGSEWSEISILNLETMEHFPEKIPRARWSEIIWKKDNSGFYYTRFPIVGEVPDGQEVFNSHIRYHTLNTDPNNDRLIYACPERPQEYPMPVLSPDEKFMLIVLHRFVSNDLYIIDLEAQNLEAKPIVENSSNFYSPRIHKNHIYFWSDFENSNYAIYKTTRSNLDIDKWECIIDSKDTVLVDFQLTKNNIAVTWLSNVSSKITIHDLNGNPVSKVPIPERGSVQSTGGSIISSTLSSDSIFFNYENFIQPPTTFSYQISNKTLSILHQSNLKIESDKINVKDVWYQSKDGTKVHMFVIQPKDLELNSKNPTILYGYGGFDVSMTPYYGPSILTWVENGGVYAIANIRGGGEHGEAWHKAGQLGKKQNVFDDFIYAGKHLIDLKYCSTQTLGISGGSNGGLLVGAVAVQEPSLFGAVYCSVPLLDMIRYHQFSIGKTWTPEYGNPDNEKDFQWLYAYSPYHNVSATSDSPAILFKTALNDSRVEPCHALKMTALMQNLSNIQKPILLLVDSAAGHGVGRPLDKMITDSAVFLSFFEWRLKES